MASATREVVANAGLTMDDIALVVPHQANRRIIDSAARALNLPPTARGVVIAQQRV